MANANGKITWTNERRKLSELIPWDINPASIDKDSAKRLEESLDEFGQVETIAISPENEIYDGHQRQAVWGASAKFGRDLVVDVRVSSRELTERERKKLTIFLRRGTIGQIDFDTLANNWELDDLLEWGMDKKELDLDLWAGPVQDDPGAQMDKAEELREKWQTSTGQLWRLGEHRLIVGDCTDRAIVERVIRQEIVDMVWTDPPYGMNLQVEIWNTPAQKGQWVSNKKNYEPVIGDGDDFRPELITSIFDLFGNTKEIFLFGADYFSELIPDRHSGSWIVWDKRAGGLEDVEWSTSEFELCWSKQRHHRKIARIRWMDVHGMESQDTDKRVHPTQKPLELVNWFFDRWGKQDDIVYDPFLGSGTTLIACERLGRKCRAVEISPAYCAVAIQRWYDMTGGIPELIGEPVIQDESG